MHALGSTAVWEPYLRALRRILKEESRKAMLMLSDAAETMQTSDAAFWVTAFLCGFGERFASDIIARLEPKAEAGGQNF